MDPKAKAKQSKKIVSIILITTAILAIIAVITGYYYLQINDVAPTEIKASQGCACYFVASSDTVKSCADVDPKDAFEFQVGTTNSSSVCSASCDLASATPLVNSASTPLACRLQTFSAAPGCIDIAVENEDEKRYANTVPTGKELNIKAKFKIPSTATAQEEFYNGFSIVINGQKTDFQVAQASSVGEGQLKEYIVSTKLKDYSASDALTIQAYGNSKTGAQITSDACNRVITVDKPKVASCTQIDAEIINDSNGVPKVSEVALSTAAITNAQTVSVKFTLGKDKKSLTTKDLSSKLANNSLILSQNFLYSSSNFVDNQNFSILNNEKDNIDISAVVYVNGQVIASQNCTGTFEIPVEAPRDPVDTGGNETPSTPTDNDDDNETPTDPTDGGETGNTSDFLVSKSTTLACVERVTPDNTVRYTINITNRDSETENVVRIEDKLPLGFTYKANSTLIDGVAQTDTGLVTVTDVGESQQITFEKSGGWDVGSSSSMTIRFTAVVSTNALTGSNLNEVVVVPTNIPEDSASLRASSSVTVAQSCTSPETGIFDSTVSKVILSVFIILLGTYFYFSQNGILLSERLLTSSIGKFASKMSLKRSNPKKYFEESFIEKLEREKKD